MSAPTTTVRSLDDAIRFFDQTFAANPERDGPAAREAALAGKRRKYAGLTINHLAVPGDRADASAAFTPPRLDMKDSPEADLARTILGMLGPLDLLNPVSPVFPTGRGTGSLATLFGIPLNPDAGDSPAFTRPLAAVLDEPEPDVAEAGIMPQVRERIELIKRRVPPRFKIGLPDMQGPFNIAHAVIGEEAMTAPILEPECFREFMTRVTTAWIAVRRTVLEWIGPEYRAPGGQLACVAECSVNLVSADFYREHLLEHDRRIADAFGPLCIHPCSGPHVFKATLEGLPVALTEAGHIEKTAAGAIGVAEALALIGRRPIALAIGEELPKGREEAVIRSHLDLYASNPRLLFNYTGMHWRRKDRPVIRDLHRRLDAYWAERYGNAA